MEAKDMTERLNLRLTAEQLALIERAAEKKGLSASAFARMAALELAQKQGENNDDRR